MQRTMIFNLSVLTLAAAVLMGCANNINTGKNTTSEKSDSVQEQILLKVDFNDNSFGALKASLGPADPPNPQMKDLT